MPSYHIRTAAGIQPVKDWFIKHPTAPTTTHSMTAGIYTNNDRGYANGATSTEQYGVLTPDITGNMQIKGLVWSQPAANSPTIVYLAYQSGAVAPPDSDDAFVSMAITGIFTDSAGVSVTRTLTRANADFTNASALVRQWQFRNAKAAQFIASNSYSVVITRTAAGGGQITRVREAYVRTATGIQKYWPPSPANTIVLTSQLFTRTLTNAAPAACICGFGMNGDGDFLENNMGSLQDRGDWISPKAAAPGGYQVRAIVESGPLAAGSSATNTWLTLAAGTSFSWNVQRTQAQGLGHDALSLRIDIRDALGTIVSTTGQSAQVTRT